jgi:hypothetical protein
MARRISWHLRSSYKKGSVDMWLADSVTVRREVDHSALGPVPIGTGYDVLELNQEYFDLEIDFPEAITVVEEESGFITAMEAAEGDWDAIVALLDERFDEPDDISGLDAGMSGAVAALAAIGARPLSSCNGGTLGDTHRSDVPHILVASPANLVVRIDGAAATAGCGLINNDGYLELFADDLRKMNLFARALLGMSN